MHQNAFGLAIVQYMAKASGSAKNFKEGSLGFEIQIMELIACVCSMSYYMLNDNCRALFPQVIQFVCISTAYQEICFVG